MNQREATLAVLQAKGSVSARELMTDHGIYRAGARVYELRALGHNIETTQKTGETAVYHYKGARPLPPVSPLKPGVERPSTLRKCPRCEAYLGGVRPTLMAAYVEGHCRAHGWQAVPA